MGALLGHNDERSLTTLGKELRNVILRGVVGEILHKESPLVEVLLPVLPPPPAKKKVLYFLPWKTGHEKNELWITLESWKVFCNIVQPKSAAGCHMSSQARTLSLDLLFCDTLSSSSDEAQLGDMWMGYEQVKESQIPGYCGWMWVVSWYGWGIATPRCHATPCPSAGFLAGSIFRYRPCTFWPDRRNSLFHAPPMMELMPNPGV